MGRLRYTPPSCRPTVFLTDPTDATTGPCRRRVLAFVTDRERSADAPTSTAT
ncbi:hypothetical protein HBB16_14425 [Pseudonocardia sp. MCCB 268]|nr:hypothetical protein [Pseudonocardia cytotoxica]